MANEEVLGPRKTMFVLVIVVGCFAVLWPRILSPLLLGGPRDALKAGALDRDAGCCEVIFATEVAVLEVINAVCNTIVQADVKVSPYAAKECRRAVNETCGIDIAEFLKKSDNVGKTTKMLLDTMKTSNSSCLKEHFGAPVLSFSHTQHTALNAWALKEDSVKQERAAVRGLAHPALRERGRAIPAPAPRPAPLPPQHRVYSNPLAGYFELEVKPPPIPGMRPPLGAPGGPAPAPKSSMGIVMPIYTICIIIFFVYTLSKILFKRAGSLPYEPVTADPQFRRRVFRDDSRATPDKLVVTAISGLVAEVHQQMEANYARNQQSQDVQDNEARPYTNGTVLHTGPVQIVASEYKEKSPELPKTMKEPTPEPKELSPEPREPTPEPKEPSPEPKELSPEPKEPTPELKEPTPELKELTPEPKELTPEDEEEEECPELDPTEELIKLTQKIEEKTDTLARLTGDFLSEERDELTALEQKTSALLEEALQEGSPERGEGEEGDSGSVKVVGMEVTAHTADGRSVPRAPPTPPAPPAPRPHEPGEVASIYLETAIPQQSRVLVADFAEDRDGNIKTKHSPMVVSGKMTLSLIQDAPRDTPDRDLESTLDDFTTASALTQPAEEKEELSDEEEEIEIEEIEEEVEEEEEEEEEEDKH